MTIILLKSLVRTGAFPGFGRGGQEFFYLDLLGGSGACPPPPPRIFFKGCNVVRFGVYFDQILSLKNFKNYHFLYKKFKNCNFLYKRLNILDTRLLWGNYSLEEFF